MRRLVAVIAVIAVAATAASCGGSDGAELAVSAPWSRPTPANATNAVLYAVVSSDTDDELVKVSVPASIAARTELHAGGVEGGSHAGHHGGGEEMATMEQVETFPVPGGGSIEFSPGGNHVMLVDLAAPLVRGDSYIATFEFSSGRRLDVEVQVSDNAPR